MSKPRPAIPDGTRCTLDRQGAPVAVTILHVEHAADRYGERIYLVREENGREYLATESCLRRKADK